MWNQACRQWLGPVTKACFLVFLSFAVGASQTVFGSFSGGLSWNVFYQPTDPSEPLQWNSLITLAGELLGSFKLASQTAFSRTGFDTQTFTFAATVDLWNLYGELKFSPLVGGWDHFLWCASIDLDGVRAETKLFLSYVDVSTYLQFQFAAAIGSTSVTIETRYKGCDLAFGYTKFALADIAFAGIEGLGFVVEISKDGFEYLEATVSLPMKLCGWESFLDVGARFTSVQKEMKASVRWTKDRTLSPCLTFYSSLIAESDPNGIHLKGLEIYGLRIECNLGDVTLRGITALNPSYAQELLGTTKPGYFELIELGGPIPSCCGSPGRWSIGTFFSTLGASLGGLAEVRVSVEWEIARRVVATVRMSVTNAGLDSLMLGVEITW